MHWKRRTVFVLAALTGGVMLSCDETTGPPVTYAVTLTDPNAFDGAILFSVRGPAGTLKTASSENVVIWSALGPDSVHAAVIGEFGSGTIALFDLPSGANPRSYGLTVLEVADRNNAVRPSLGGYALTLER